MIDPAAFALYVAAAGAMILSPGPDTAYVLARSVGEGRRVGLASAAGISLGVLVHTLAAVLGLAALVRASEPAFAAVRYVGAAYLVYLGVRTVRDRGSGIGAIGGVPADRAAEAGGDEDAGSDRPNPLFEAVAVNVLNPQVALFFLAFLPGFASGARVGAQLLFLGGTYAALTAAYLGSVAAVAGSARRLLLARPAAVAGLRWVTGIVLVGLGLRAAVAGPGM